MKKLKLIAVIIGCGLILNSCSREEDPFQEENAVSKALNKTIPYLYDNYEDVSAKKGLSPQGFCDYVQITSTSNGAQMRSRVNLSWTVGFNFPPPPPLPGLVNYTVEFEPGISIGSVLTYGPAFTFNEVFISTQTNIDVFYNSLQELNGAVQGRWRVKVQDCDFSDWKDYYFDL